MTLNDVKDSLPKASPVRIILHWTAGSYIASSLDKRHYHYLIEWHGPDDGPKIVEGRYSITDNDNSADGDYAAHVSRLNTGSIGVAICGMAGAKERPLNFGRYPITEPQWQLAAELCAVLCEHYDIAVTPRDVLSHCEVPEELGVAQRGKWDVAHVAFQPNLTWTLLNEEFRMRVEKSMDQIVSPAPCPDLDVIDLQRGQSMKIMLPEGAEPMIHIGGGEIHIEVTT